MSWAVGPTVGYGGTSLTGRSGASLPCGKAITASLAGTTSYTGGYRVGTAEVTDLVISDGVPVSRKLWLFVREVEGIRLLRKGWSDADGTYAFEYLAPGIYFIVAEDYTQAKASIIVDQITAVAMT